MGLIQAANREDVLLRSGKLAQDLNFHHGLPDNVVETLAGDSTIGSEGHRGREYVASVKSGEILEATGAGAWVASFGSMRRYVAFAGHNADYSDPFQIGGVTGGAGQQTGAHLNLADDQYVVSGTTASAPDINSFPRYLLQIDISITDGETTFTLYGGSTGKGIEDQTVIQETPTGIGEHIVACDSNGNQDSVFLKYAMDIYPLEL